MKKMTGSVFLVLLAVSLSAAGCSYQQDFVKGEEIHQELGGHPSFPSYEQAKATLPQAVQCRRWD